jgi:hypothetical protein
MLLPDKDARTLTQFFNGCHDSLLPPYKQPITSMLRVIEGPRSLLEANEFQPPKHADHVSEDPQRNNPQDTYLAWPLEGIQLAHEPLGVIRISNAASLKRHFGPNENTTLQAAARHVSHLLLREYMQQESYLEGVLADRGNEEEFYHCISRLNEKIVDLDDQLRDDPSYLPEPRRGELQSLVKRLREICDSALAGPQLRILALRIRSEDTSAWTVRELASFVQEWLSTANLGATVKAVDSEPIRGIQHRSILWWCLVAEELVKNLRRHQGIERPAVFLRGAGTTRLYVGSPRASGMLDAPIQWDSYGHLWEGKDKGGGARLLESASELAAIAVEFGYVESPEPGHTEMIARVVSQEGSRQ